MGRTMQREFPETPLMSVGAVVVEGGRVLLVRRGCEPLKGEWSLPGGLVELGESLEAALIREVGEGATRSIRFLFYQLRSIAARP